MSKRRSNKDVKVAQKSADHSSNSATDDSPDQAADAQSPSNQLEVETPEVETDDAANQALSQELAEAHISEDSADAQAEAASESSAQASTDESHDESTAVASDDSADESADDTSEPVASSVEHADEPKVELPAAVSDEELALQVEVALMTTDRAMPAVKLSDILGKVGAKAINDAVASLNKTYESTGRSFRIEQVANGLQILTLPKYAGVMELLHKTRSAGKLTPAAMETLAIIAYKQPILRVQIEAIRGVASGELVRSLMERRLVKITGRSEEIGRPMLYGTTKTFLETFGLSSLKDLPKAEDFASGKGL